MPWDIGRLTLREFRDLQKYIDRQYET